MMSPTELRERNRRRDKFYFAAGVAFVLSMAALITLVGLALGMGS